MACTCALPPLGPLCRSTAIGQGAGAPIKIQLWPNKYREPDVILILPQRLSQHTEQYWIGADLVIEVVSPNDRQRDTKTKRRGKLLLARSLSNDG
ncbi:MAG: Uma2 family endonuclease [Caldilinea sp. CFX5]|nr:Uma2 family endonuclease [Caldilinea sp. CFX5]